MLSSGIALEIAIIIILNFLFSNIYFRVCIFLVFYLKNCYLQVNLFSQVSIFQTVNLKFFSNSQHVFFCSIFLCIYVSTFTTCIF